MKIPKQLQIGGQTITISIDNNIANDGIMGSTNHVSNTVKLCTEYRGDKVSEDQINQTLWHEITHLILDNLGNIELSEDEVFVQSFSLLIHQAINTLK